MASQDALEVMFSYWLSRWCFGDSTDVTLVSEDPTEDFNDVTMASEDTIDDDDHDGH